MAGTPCTPAIENGGRAGRARELAGAPRRAPGQSPMLRAFPRPPPRARARAPPRGPARAARRRRTAQGARGVRAAIASCGAWRCVAHRNALTLVWVEAHRRRCRACGPRPLPAGRSRLARGARACTRGGAGPGGGLALWCVRPRGSRSSLECPRARPGGQPRAPPPAAPQSLPPHFSGACSRAHHSPQRARQQNRLCGPLAGRRQTAAAPADACAPRLRCARALEGRGPGHLSGGGHRTRLPRASGGRHGEPPGPG